MLSESFTQLLYGVTNLAVPVFPEPRLPELDPEEPELDDPDEPPPRLPLPPPRLFSK